MNMRKRLFQRGIALSLVVCLMVSLFPFGAFADNGDSVTDTVYDNASVAEAVYGDISVTSSVYSDPSHFSYSNSFACYDEHGGEYQCASITGYSGSGGNIVIPDEIDGYPVTSIYINAFRGNSDILSVVIPEGVTFIWQGAFSMMPSLTSVILPEGITGIGEGSFAENENLTSITLPSTLSKLPDNAFAASGLTSVVIPSSVTSIGNNAFGSTKLESVVIPSSVTEIGIGAFDHCYKMNGIIIEGLNTEISDFIGTIPQQATIVGHSGSSAEDYAVANNINFKDISTGTDVPNIDDGGHDPISRYHRGEAVVIRDLFDDEDLAAYFADWVSYEWGNQWSVTDSINKHDVEAKIMDLYVDSGFNYVSFGNPSSNMAISSLEGLQIFDKGLFKNPRIAKNIYFPQSSLTNVDALSFLEDAKNIFLNDGQLTNVDGLSNLRSVDTLDLGRNKLTDISGLANLTEVSGTLSLNDNLLTNKAIPTFLTLLQVAIPDYVNAAYNYFVLDDVESEQFFDELMKVTTDVSARSPQYNFAFKSTGNVKIEYRERDSNELLDSELFTNLDISESKTYNAKAIDGYTLDDDPEKTVTVRDVSDSVTLTPEFRLRGIRSPDLNTSVEGLINWAKITFGIEDETVLTYDLASRQLEVIGGGSSNIDIIEDGVYRGTYSVEVESGVGSPLVFYYKSNAPSTMNHTLTILAPFGQGSVFPTVGTHEYPAGQSVSLSTINSVPGYEFEKWVIDGEDVYYPNPFTEWVNIVMDRDYVAQAVFKPTSPAQLTLTVNKNGEGLVSPMGVTSRSPAEPVTLTVNPAIGHRFVKWVVNGVESYMPVLPIIVNTNTIATAYFEPIPPVDPIQYTLSVDKLGEGDISPAGVSKFLELQTVALSANPSNGYKFVKWVVNDQEFVESDITITMDKDKTATAYFELIPPSPVIKGELSIEFRDVDTNEEIQEKKVLTDLDLGEHSYTAESLIGVFELVGDALKEIVLTISEPIQKITFFYKAKVTAPPTDDEDPVDPPVVDPPVIEPPVEPPVKVDPVDPPAVQEPSTPPVIEEPADPPVVEQPEEPVEQEKPVVEEPITEEPVEDEPVVVKEPESNKTAPSVNAPTDIDPVVEQATILDQVRIIAIDDESGEVLKDELLQDLPLGIQEISAPAIEGYESLAPSVQSVTIKAEGRKLIVEFRYRKQMQYGEVFGVVTDNNGNPLKGIQVELHSKPRVTYTDQNGEYHFKDVELGQHTVILKNPLTKEEIGKVEVVVYQGGQQASSNTESLQDVAEIKAVIELSESLTVQRIDFIIDPLVTNDTNIPQIPQEPEPVEPEGMLPIIPIATPIFIIAVIIYFRRKNVVIYDISDGHANKGLILKKLRIKAMPETTIDLSGIGASDVRIQFKNPAAFRRIDLFLQYGESKLPVSLPKGQAFFDITVSKD
jgi:hypothetical protein